MLKEISIEIIRRCPNQCIHCSSLSSEACTEIIPVEVFKRVINGAKSLGLTTICFSGGEPFLHPDIVEMIEYTFEKGINCNIYSSGIYVDLANNRSAIPESLLDSIQGKVNKIIFNIEAVDEATYDLIMGTQGCLKYLEESIRAASKRGIITEGHFVPMKINKNHIERVVHYGETLGLSKISYLRLVLHGRALQNKEKVMLSEQEMKELESELLRLHEINPSNIRIGVPLSGETSEAHCEAANGKLNIRYDGNVYPCEVFKNNKIFVLENVAPDNIYEKKIEEIYNNSEYLKRVRMLVKDFPCHNSCENCIGQYYMNRE